MIPAITQKHLQQFARTWALMWLLAISGLIAFYSVPKNLSSGLVIEISDIMEEQQEESDHLEEKDFQLITDFFSDTNSFLGVASNSQRLGREVLQCLNWTYRGTESPPPKNRLSC